MALPTLFWGIVRNDHPSTRSAHFEIIRVTRRADNQISGVRDGDISSTTWRRSNVVGEHATEELALAAIEEAERINKRLHIGIRDADNALERLRKDRRDQVAVALRGDLK